MFSLVLANPAQSDWIQTSEVDRIAYFLHDEPPEIQRYDMTLDQWLAPLPLSDVPSAFAVDSDGIYVGFDIRIVRLDLDGTGEIPLNQTVLIADEMMVHGEFLHLLDYGGLKKGNYVSRRPT